MTFLRRIAAITGAAVIAIAVLGAPAQAQAVRTWVSGVGDDANPCSRTAPCRTWAEAIGKTAEGGTVSALDSGSFGAAVITEAITIDGTGVAASASAATSAITIDAGVADDVVLRNIELKGTVSGETCTSQTGLRIVSARSVRLDGVSISGFQRAVDTPLSGSSADIFVDLAFNELDVYNNCEYGLRIAPDLGHQARATIDGSVITGSNIALSVAAGAEAWVSDSKLYLNNLGVQPDGGPIHSLCGNAVAGNASPGTFTDEAPCGGPAPTAPPIAPPTPSAPVVSYCSVPRLKGSTVTQARSRLHKAGCRLGKVGRQKVSRSKQRKKVQSQSIPARVQVRQGTAVAIRIGK